MCQPSLSLEDKTEETTTPCSPPEENTQHQSVGPVRATNLPASTPPPAGVLSQPDWSTLFVAGSRQLIPNL